MRPYRLRRILGAVRYLRPVFVASALIAGAFVFAGTWETYPWVIVDRTEYHMALDYQAALATQSVMMEIQQGEIRRLETELRHTKQECLPF